MPEPLGKNNVSESTSYIKTGLLTSRFIKFGIVGASGVVVNMGGLYIFKEYAGIPYFVASLIAIELSILSNFTINLLWTWKDRAGQGSLWTKILRYHIGAGATAFLCNYLILIALTEILGMHYMVSNLIGIAVGTLANYVINDLWTFRKHS
jgi:dolichol-phosphate mannosyltransferase